MSDFKLNADWDMDFSARRAHLVYDMAYRGQRLKIALRHIMGEWVFDLLAGTDYLGAIWGKSTDLSRRAEFRRRCLQIPGIIEVLSMDLVLGTERRLKGAVKLLQAEGTELEVRFTGRD